MPATRRRRRSELEDPESNPGPSRNRQRTIRGPAAASEQPIAPPIPERDQPEPSSINSLQEIQEVNDSAEQQLQDVGNMLDAEEEAQQNEEDVPDTPREGWSRRAREYPFTRDNPAPPNWNFGETYHEPTPNQREQQEIDTMLTEVARLRQLANDMETNASVRQTSLRTRELQESAAGLASRVMTPISNVLSDAASSARRTSETLLLPAAQRVARGAVNAVALPARAAGEAAFEMANGRRIRMLRNPVGQTPGEYSANLEHAAALEALRQPGNQLQNGGKRRAARRGARRSATRRSANRTARRSNARRNVRRSNARRTVRRSNARRRS